jgi:hypothetical protein
MKTARTHAAPANNQPPEAIVALQGRLKIKWVNGRNGEFAVGTLNTQLGDFSVKDQLLEEYDEGEYIGRFGIARIYSKSFEYFGRITIETRATLAFIEIEDMPKVGKPAEPPSEPDPIDEAPPAPPVDVKKSDPPATPAPVPTQKSEPKAEDDELLQALFGDELAQALMQGGAIKLDTTVDRIKFRQQRDSLKAMGYRFDPQNQNWVRN